MELFGNLLVGGLATLIFLVAYRSIFALKAPRAHWSSSISSFWILWLRYNNLEREKLHEAHLKYGPVLLIAPNEISVNDYKSIRTIYGGGFEKSQWYSIFDNYGVPCMFSIQKSRPHKIRKKLISSVYSKSAIQSSPVIARQSQIIIFERLIPSLKFAVSSNQFLSDVEMEEIWNATAMDFITAFLFGIKNSSNFLVDKMYRNHWFRLYNATKVHNFFPQELPNLTKFLKLLQINIVPTWVEDAKRELEAWTKDRCDSTFDFIQKMSKTELLDQLVDPADQPVVFKALMAGIEKEKAQKTKDSSLKDSMLRYPELSIASEMIDQLSAGHETVGITLADIFWHLSLRPSLQESLRSELLRLSPNMRVPKTLSDVQSLPSPSQLDSLPLLHAVLMETLRQRTEIPVGQPRKSPYPSVKLGSYMIPGNFRVGMQSYSVHHNPNVFPDPETWDYMRWLDTENGYSNEQRRARDSHFCPFSIGSRMCIGNHFAMHEIKLIIAAVYTNFRTCILEDGIEGDSCRPSSKRRRLLKYEIVSLS